MKVILEMNEKQAILLNKILDFYSRVGIGQFEEIARHPTFEKELIESKGDEINNFLEKKERAEKHLTAAKKELMGAQYTSNASYGIHNEKVDESCRVAFDMIQVIRHELWKAEENPRQYVNSAYPCLQTSKKETPLIKCTIEK